MTFRTCVLGLCQMHGSVKVAFGILVGMPDAPGAAVLSSCVMVLLRALASGPGVSASVRFHPVKTNWRPGVSTRALVV